MRNLHLLAAVALGFSALAPQTSLADRGRWFEDSHEKVRMGKVINLGQVDLGDDSRRGRFVDRDVIDIGRNSRVECNLTHLKLTAMGDRVKILRVEVKYYNGNMDSIDLTQEVGGLGRREGFPGGRHNRPGLHLRAYQSSQWLSVNDVADQRDNGRCIEKLRITGVDAPDNGFERRFGNMRPATVTVDALVMPRRPNFMPPREDNWNRPSRPGMDRPGNDRPGRPGPGGHDLPLPPREPKLMLGKLSFTLFKSDNESFKNTNVSTPVKRLILDAEGGSVFVKRIQITYTNGQTYNLEIDDSVSYNEYDIPMGVIASVSAKGSGGKVKLLVSK